MNRFFSFLLSQRERAARAVPWLGLLIFALTGTLGVFLGGSYASLGIGGGLLLFGAVWMADGRAPKPHGVLAGFCFFFLLVCAALDLQAMDKWLAWKETLRLATILLPLLLLSCPAVQARAAQADVFKYAAIAAALGMFALGAELFSGTPLLKWMNGSGVFDEKAVTKYNRGFSYAVLLSWPFMASLWAEPKRRWTVAPFFLVMLLPLTLTLSRATQLGFVMAAVVFAAALLAPVVVRWGLGLLAVLATAWPFVAQAMFDNYLEGIARLPSSWKARMEIWDFMSYRILERPWLGWGLGSSHELQPLSPHSASYVVTTGPVSHPHNAFTQLWVELGLPGLALGVFFALFMLRLAGRVQKKRVPFALAAWTMAFALAMVAYDFWTDSLLAAFALTAFAFALLERKTARTNS